MYLCIECGRVLWEQYCHAFQGHRLLLPVRVQLIMQEFKRGLDQRVLIKLTGFNCALPFRNWRPFNPDVLASF